ncbi:hypothetical protein DDZ13_09635 [Coraliomargarita sinensis]|uniref:Uncharacterized protein n=1 Tax=Coraliomargarita sinensis TaxID=2174842 RepID=A0A317ZKL9_9BACT|nr:hypothetical protein [Coraliomargarita sinensis]PXA03891.1 hypothetical protein DDZ13_09635 [Coraliomargarita sinensis]
MKYRNKYIVNRLKEWLADPHRCSASDLQQELDYFAAQHLGPALLRLQEIPKDQRMAAIKEENKKCKHVTEKCLLFMAQHVLDTPNEPPACDFHKTLELNRTDLFELSDLIGSDEKDSASFRDRLIETGRRMIQFGETVERLRIEGLLQTYALVYFYNRWDKEAATRDEKHLIEEFGHPLLKARGLPSGKTALYRAIHTFEELAEAITDQAPPSCVMTCEFKEWFHSLILKITEMSKHGPDGFSDHFHLMGALPGLREYGRSADAQIEEKPAPKKSTKKTPEAIAETLNARRPQQRSAFITRTFTKIDDALNVINLLDTTEITVPTDQISATRQSLEAAINKLNALDRTEGGIK